MNKSLRRSSMIEIDQCLHFHECILTRIFYAKHIRRPKTVLRVHHHSRGKSFESKPLSILFRYIINIHRLPIRDIPIEKFFRCVHYDDAQEKLNNRHPKKHNVDLLKKHKPSNFDSK